jgi:hypothetical protein
MRELSRVLTCVTMLIVVAALPGCTGVRDSARGSGAMIPITDVGSVAGTWVGVVSRATGSDEGDWLEMSVKNDGTFQTFSARQIGVLLGNGTLTITDGRLAAVGPRGTAMLTLYDRQGRALVLDFRETGGVRYSAELRPKM